jgi:hypothetical protein
MTTLYTSPQLVAAELRATIPFSTSTIPTEENVLTWIDEEMSDIDRIAGKTFNETTYTETLDTDGSDRIQLSISPVITVSTVLYSPYEIGSSGYSLSTVKVEDTDFTVYKDQGELRVISTNWSPEAGNKRVRVIYTAGYETVPSYIQKLCTKKVTKRVIDTLVSKDINEKQSGKSISVGSISITKPSDFGVAHYKALTDDIDKLTEKVVGGTTAFRYVNY